MKLYSMKLSKADRKKTTGPMKISSTEYPSGLRITLDKEALKKLGISVRNIKAGDEFQLHAAACVKSTRLVEGSDYDSTSMELQIEQLGLEKQTKSLRDAVDNGVKDAKE